MRKAHSVLALMLSIAVLGTGIHAQEPRIFMPRSYTDPGGWFKIRVPNEWEEKCDAELGRRTVYFAPAAGSEDAGKMDMSVALITGWSQRTVTDEILRTLSAEMLERLREQCKERDSVFVVRETKKIIMVRQSAIRNIIDEGKKDGSFDVIRMFIVPTAIHSYVIQYRLPKKEDEMLSVQFDRMIRSFRIQSPKLESIDLEKLEEHTAAGGKVTVKCPPTWERKEVTGGDEGRYVMASPKARGGLKDPCPGVVIEKIPQADLRFKGETLTPEQIILKYRDLYLEGLAERYDEARLLPKAARARLGRQAALAFKFELAKGEESRYGLLVISIQKGTVVQVFMAAPAASFHHYAPLFGRILATMQAF